MAGPWRVAAAAFGLLALTSGALQVWAFVATDVARHLVLGLFAAAVGGCVIWAAARG